MLMLLPFLSTGGFAQGIDSWMKKSACKTDTCLVNFLHREFKSIRYDYPDSAKDIAAMEYKISKEIGYAEGFGWALYDLADYHEIMGDFDKSLEYCSSALKTARDNKLQILEAEVLNLTGIVYSDQGDYAQSLQFYEKAKKLSVDIAYKPGEANAYANIGVTYFFQADYGKAIENYINSLRIVEELKDTNKIVTLKNNLSVFYQYKGQYDKAISNCRDLLVMLEGTDDLKAIADVYNNISTNYSFLDSLDQALEYLEKSLVIYEKQGNQKALAAGHNNKANILIKARRMKEAISEMEKAIAICEENGYESDITFYQRGMAVGLFYAERYPEALNWALLSLKGAEALGQKETVRDNYNLIADIYKGLGDYRNSMDYLFKYVELSDSIQIEEYEKNTAEMEARYQNEKKEKEIELMKKEDQLKSSQIERQNAIRNFLIAGLFLVMVIVVIVTRNYLQKKKVNLILAKQNHEISQQKEEIVAQRDEIEAQRDLVMEQKDHIEIIHKEQTDSIHYARHIQNALLPKGIGDAIGDWFLVFMPKDIVSGDFFWSGRVENKIVFAVADCTGHGVPGAFMSMLGISTLNKLVNEQKLTDPATILNFLRESIIAALNQKHDTSSHRDGIDIALCVYDLQEYTLTYAGANNPCWILPKASEYSELVEIRADKMPAALYERMEKFENKTTKMSSGDMIVIMSDGLEDQFGGDKGKKLKAVKVKEWMIEIAGKPSPEMKEHLEKRISDWMGGQYEQIDDITLLAVKIP
jgi:serine phosphatase RsbU (regulator of sigma subunit)